MELSEREPPAGEPTLAYPDQIATVNVLSARARAQRATEPGAERTTASDASPIKIGRYQLLEMVGAGGMGLVWGAWDPELERRVALKLVRLTSQDSRDRMLREGQVLARLSHPNVVPIFDVGVMGDQVYLVMEWVRGTTLRTYAGDRPGVPALLDAYRQAGAGLAAAHDAGVIHRDFKPDNAIRGDDGRVRVLDFGIAHQAASASSPPAAGTPRYMAPEQERGEQVAAASDQYAFCVSLREALASAGEPPGWIAAILARGTAEPPAERFGSMAELLAALGRDPARRWRRGALGIAAIATALGAFAIGNARSERAAAIAPCTGAASELATSWDPGIRERMAAHLRSLGPLASRESERLAAELDAYGTAWVGEHRRTCLARERQELTPTLYEARLGCLARTRSQLGAVGELMTTVDAAGLPPALVAARSLPDLRGCVDADVLVPPPVAVADRVKIVAAQIERARVRAIARQADSAAVARAATLAARDTGHAPLIARALVVEGRAATINASEDARGLFAEAMTLALRASDDETAVEAYARWIYERARTNVTAADGANVMEPIAERLGRRGRFARALMYNNLGVARLIAHDQPGARALLERAVTVAGDEPAIELASFGQNLAQLERDPARAAQRFTAVRDRYAAVLGATHPDTLDLDIAVALLTPESARARRQLEHACDALERWHQTYSFASCAYEAGWLADEDGDPVAARAWMTKMLVAPPSDHKAAIGAAYIAATGSSADRDQRLAAIAPIATGKAETWWNKLDVADALVVLARSDPGAWQRALTTLDAVDVPIHQRRLNRARRMVAAQWRTTHPDDARRVAGLALAWYRDVRGEEATVAELTAIATTAARSR